MSGGFYGKQMMQSWACLDCAPDWGNAPRLEIDYSHPELVRMTAVSVALPMVCPDCGNRKTVLLWLRAENKPHGRAVMAVTAADLKGEE